MADFVLAREPKAIVPVMRERPDVLKRAMSRIADTMIDFAKRSIDAGASGIFFGVVGFAGADVLSEQEYEELVLPYDLKVLEGIPSEAWFNVVHLCGPRVHFQLGRRFPGQVISWSVHDEGNPSLAEGIELTGRAAMGGVAHQATLLAGPRIAIAEEVLAAASSNGGRGIIVAPGCSVPTTTPDGNLMSVSEAAGAA